MKQQSPDRWDDTIVASRDNLERVYLKEWGKVLQLYHYAGRVGNVSICGTPSLIMVIPGITKEDFEEDIIKLRGGETE